MPSQRHASRAGSRPGSRPGSEIQDRLLDATLASVLAVGVRRTTVADVARRAGVSRMTVYRHVPDATALVLDLVTRELAAVITAAEDAAADLPTARERLVDSTVRVVRRLPAEPLLQRILDVDPELLLPYLTDRLGSTQRMAVGHVRRALAAGIADGSIRPCDPDLVAYCLVATISAYVVGGRITAAETDPDRVADELTHLLDCWLATPGGAAA